MRSQSCRSGVRISRIVTRGSKPAPALCAGEPRRCRSEPADCATVDACIRPMLLFSTRLSLGGEQYDREIVPRAMLPEDAPPDQCHGQQTATENPGEQHPTCDGERDGD